MSEKHTPEEQIRLCKEAHKELAEVTKKYLGNLWAPLLIGAIEHIKLAAFESYATEAKKEEP